MHDVRPEADSKDPRSSWLEQPTRAQLWATVAVWLVGTGLTLMAATDLFSELPRLGIMQMFMLVGATATLAKVVVRYRKNARAQSAR